MKNKSLITCIVILIAILSSVAASIGIFTNEGPGKSVIKTVRGTEVTLYGKGIYHHMSEEVAPQGIAQDVITLFVAIPFLLISLVSFRRGSLRGKILLTGVLGYFLVTYFFFTLMAMYNQLFLLWIMLLSLSFYGFLCVFQTLSQDEIMSSISKNFPRKTLAFFLIFTSVMIALLWLSVVLPPALTGSIPNEVEHYTTLVVQALDLSILLPAAFISGILLYRKSASGYKLALIYSVFLSLLMTALTAKIVAMGLLGFNTVPAVFIIPAFNILSVIFVLTSLRSVNKV